MTDEPLEPPTDLDRRIGRRIAFFREEAGLTRAELAEQLAPPKTASRRGKRARPSSMRATSSACAARSTSSRMICCYRS